MTSVSDRIMDRVRDKGRGKWVCTANDFLDLGSRSAVDQALSRLVHSRDLVRVTHGLYHLPAWNDFLNRQVPPSPSDIVAAIARRNGIRVVPAGLAAANSLGLTTAVPVRPIYWTDGSSSFDIRDGDRIIEFHSRSSKVMSWVDRPSQALAHGLYWLGKDAIQDDRIFSIVGNLSADIRRDFVDNSSMLPGWMADIVKFVSDSLTGPQGAAA